MIKFIDFTREYNAIGRKIDGAIKRVLKCGRFVLGSEVESFEREFAQYCGVKYCVGVNSGTDALFLSMLAAGIGKGDEVIVPVNTAVPTAMAVKMTGATPVFADCDENHLLDIEQIAGLINKKTKAIIAVHLYGLACDMDKLLALAKKYKLILIEDCAQAAGAEWKGKKVGGLGDFGCFSFYPTKNLGAYGDGGAITTGNENHYSKLLRLRFYGQKERNISQELGVNSRLDELQAAVLRVKLKHLDEWNVRRRRLADLYRKSIYSHEVVLPAAEEGGRHVYHLMVAQSQKRDKLLRVLRKNGVEALIHYPQPLHLQPAFHLPNQKRTFPQAAEFSRRNLSLPLYPFLEEKEVREICKVINSL